MFCHHMPSNLLVVYTWIRCENISLHRMSSDMLLKRHMLFDLTCGWSEMFSHPFHVYTTIMYPITPTYYWRGTHHLTCHMFWQNIFFHMTIFFHTTCSDRTFSFTFDMPSNMCMSHNVCMSENMCMSHNVAEHVLSHLTCQVICVCHIMSHNVCMSHVKCVANSVCTSHHMCACHIMCACRKMCASNNVCMSLGGFGQ